MPTLEYFLVSESLAVDQTTNQASVFNIFEELRATAFPFHVPQMAAICAWNMAPSEQGQEYQALLRIVPPGGEPREQRINFVGHRLRSRIILRVIGLPIEQAGDLRFEVELNGDHQASHTVTVFEAEPGALPPGFGAAAAAASGEPAAS